MTIKAYKKINNENHKSQLNERSNGELERRFEFDEIDKEGITAHYSDGVLYVTLPKLINEDEQATTISIQ